MPVTNRATPPHRAASGLVPTWGAVAAMATGVPVALACGLADDGWWIAGPAWIGAVLVMVAADALAMRRSAGFEAEAGVPSAIETARPGEAVFCFPGRPPPGLEVVLEADPRLACSPARCVVAPGGAARFTLTPRRRGTAVLHKLHLRWGGPLGLVRRVETRVLDRAVAVIPAISLVREEAMRLFSRTGSTGRAVQQDWADSTEFHALREFQRGDDPRGVNWRQSARHAKVLVRETQAERNRTLMLALDTGRLMSEPLAGGLPRLDHAINAALVLAFVGLKIGDRVGLFAFGDRPVLSSGTVSGTAAFGGLQRLAAGLDYSTEETNFTLGLTELGAALGGRALVVVLTDFADTTGAELMIENVGRLLERHAVLFVTFRDDELAAMADTAPEDADTVSRAVVAGTLLAEREVVLARLRRLGANVVEAPARGVGPALIRRVLDLQRPDLRGRAAA